MRCLFDFYISSYTPGLLEARSFRSSEYYIAMYRELLFSGETDFLIHLSAAISRGQYPIFRAQSEIGAFRYIFSMLSNFGHFGTIPTVSEPLSVQNCIEVH